MSALTSALEGFAFGGSLIVAIGAQNAFVLRQGLKHQHIFAVTTICFLSDAFLIAVGAGGFGSIVAATPVVNLGAAIGGGIFLLVYGFMAFRRACSPGHLEAQSTASRPRGLAAVMLTTLALTWLNPHVYLDTVVLLGSIAGQYAPSGRIYFSIGAIAASFVWFYGLGFGAGRLAPLFANPRAWQILDICIGIIMWTIAYSLIAPLI